MFYNIFLKSAHKKSLSKDRLLLFVSIVRNDYPNERV